MINDVDNNSIISASSGSSDVLISVEETFGCTDGWSIITCDSGNCEGISYGCYQIEYSAEQYNTVESPYRCSFNGIDIPGVDYQYNQI